MELMAGGRPSIYTEELAAEICERIANGESLRRVCLDERMPPAGTVCRWLAEAKHIGFREQYAKARERQADAIFDEALDIADDGSNDWMQDKNPDNPGYKLNGEHVQRSRLRIDTRKWIAGKLNPKKYGEKSTTEITGKDGGPIETKGEVTLDTARKLAFLLAKAGKASEVK
jgi:hypothetical protein